MILLPNFKSNWSAQMFDFLSTYKTKLNNMDHLDIDDFVEEIAISWGCWAKLSTVESLFNRLGREGILEAWLVEECLTAIEELEVEYC